MASTLLVAIVKYGLLVLLSLFVVSAVRTVRTDIWGTRSTGRSASPAPAAKPGKPRGRTHARRLVVTEGALAGTTVSLGEGPVTLGRADDSTLVLTDDYASSRHARLVPSEGVWLVEDLGSTNGTYLGNAKVSRPTAVSVGSAIRIGKTVLELRS